MEATMAKVKANITVEAKPVVKATALLRKGTRAYIGLYGAAFQRAQMRFEQVKGATDGLFNDLVIRGADIENRAVGIAKIAQIKTSDRISAATDKMANFVPVAANSRVAELELEVAQLNAKISKLATPAKKTTASKVKMTTQKTSKAA